MKRHLCPSFMNQTKQWHRRTFLEKQGEFVLGQIGSLKIFKIFHVAMSSKLNFIKALVICKTNPASKERRSIFACKSILLSAEINANSTLLNLLKQICRLRKNEDQSFHARVYYSLYNFLKQSQATSSQTC